MRSKLVLVSADENLLEQFEVTGVTEAVGDGNIYGTDERVGATVKQAHQDATDWVEGNRSR